ncbi:unnamed protein product [Orchesella dallaii]|uniref:histone acetyltransferase n=1 Tax=Orchesella dallaii TaxID=48710 RepID=A0ABP1RQD8_9HEXA
MKDNSKPAGKVALVDTKPISIPIISPSAITTGAEKVMAIGRSQNPSQIDVETQNQPNSMVSRGTQTGGGEGEAQPGVVTEDLQEKRRLIRKQLAVLLHAVLCRVRDELIGNTGESARPCPTAFCGLMKNVLNHLRTCDARLNCPHPHCASSRQILNHWKQCSQVDCPVCSSLRRVVPGYLNTVVSNPRWRDEIMTRFQWLIRFIGPINMRMPTSTISPIHLHHAARIRLGAGGNGSGGNGGTDTDEENSRNFNMKDCEE